MRDPARCESVTTIGTDNDDDVIEVRCTLKRRLDAEGNFIEHDEHTTILHADRGTTWAVNW